MIANMAHSTLKSRGATRDGVAFGYRLKIRVIGRTTQDRSPVLLQIGSGRGRPCSRSATDGLMGSLSRQWAALPKCDRTRTFEPSGDSF